MVIHTKKELRKKLLFILRFLCKKKHPGRDALFYQLAPKTIFKTFDFIIFWNKFIIL
ncbi:hypothetical protein HMPREF0518_0934 [Lactobacillus helveticus DSM 20075 = CGMCC 1.1877]|nr:hypothetical protein HMPREF0518_0934 [Lactobacillus helveticus DSM 20075 = CGMCC 1.1877]